MQSFTSILNKLISAKDSTTPEKAEDVLVKLEERESPTSGQSKSVSEVSNPSGSESQSPTMSEEMIVKREMVYDLIKDIRDPEKPETLEELNVVSENNIYVQQFSKDTLYVRIVFVPTVPHCSLASLIGLCLRQKLALCFPEKYKLDILVKQGTHETADEVNKQINDKERVAAAMENPNLRELVQKCISEEGEYG